MTPEAILSTIETLLPQIIAGLANGMVLFIVSSGLTLVFGVLRVINFAHGSLYMIGAFIAVTIAGYFTSEAMGLYMAIFLVPLIVAGLGFVLERFLFRPIYDKEHLLQLLLTYGLTLILGDLARLIWGGDIYRLSRPDFLSGRWTLIDTTFGDVDFRLRLLKVDVALLIIGVLIAIGLWFLLQRTRFGRITRAAVANPEMLSALGINVDRVFTLSFMLGAWLAGLGGALVATKQSVSLGMDAEIIVQAFAIVVIGGLGSFVGALIGSLLVGITLSLGIILPSIAPAPFDAIFAAIPAQALPFLAMAIILIARPWGLLGKPE
ncbi:MAG: branched-chain amino acid ABC transporter permease [Chloroflexota bacterium]